jgi:hypothetical protein
MLFPVLKRRLPDNMGERLHTQNQPRLISRKKPARFIAGVGALLLLGGALVLTGGMQSQNSRQQGSLALQGCVTANHRGVSCSRGSSLLLTQAIYRPAATPPPDNTPPPDPGKSSDPASALSGGNCSAAGCPDLLAFMQAWTRWLSWILGGFGILWVLVGFYRGTEPHLSYGATAGDGPWRRILVRLFEAGLVFFISWRIGDIAALVEDILLVHQSDSPTIQGNNAGILGPPHQAIAQLIGLIIGVMVQVFLIYILPRIAFQCMSAIGMMISGRAGMFFLNPGSAQIQMAALSSVAQLIGLAIGIVAAPPVLIWFFGQIAR